MIENAYINKHKLVKLGGLLSAVLTAAYLSLFKCAHALTCPPDPTRDPDPVQIMCPIIKVFNVLLLGSGAVFVIMLVWGGVKIALALGDPKGFQSGTNTWKAAFLGFGIILGFFAILAIVLGFFGIGLGSPQQMFNSLGTAIYEFVTQPFGLGSNLDTSISTENYLP